MKPMVNCLVVVLLTLISYTTQAQEFVFRYNQMETEEVDSNLATTQHPFGAEFTEMMQLLKDFYTYEEKNSISLATTTVVEKPSIYYSVSKTSKHLVKAVKKGNMTEEEAKKGLEDILIKALNIRYQNTAELEQKLRKIKDAETIMAFYTDDIRLDM